VSDDVVTISRRFCGPPDSANGGYACGLVASHLHGDVRVRLMVPPPLEVPMSLIQTGGSWQMLNGEVLVAEGASDRIDSEIPDAVTFDEAVSAATRFAWVTGHPFPTCFVCGPQRQQSDGLCIFPGPVSNRSVVAAPWVPDRTVSNDAGEVHSEVMWAALDCPSLFGLLEFEAGATFGLLGQLTARIIRRPQAGERCVVIGWSRGKDGRKLYGGAAVYSSDGELLGNSAAVWIQPKAVTTSSP
jgi:hypothetical protein